MTAALGSQSNASPEKNLLVVSPAVHCPVAMSRSPSFPLADFEPEGIAPS